MNTWRKRKVKETKKASKLQNHRITEKSFFPNITMGTLIVEFPVVRMSEKKEKKKDYTQTHSTL